MGRGEDVGSEQDSLEALCGCPMLLLGDKVDDYDDDDDDDDDDDVFVNDGLGC